MVSSEPSLCRKMWPTNDLTVMEMAALLAAGLRDWIDLGVIIGILMLNAIVGWYQEKQAADVVASLKGDIAMKAWVVRDGQEQEILARDLVVGDIVGVVHGKEHCSVANSPSPLGHARGRKRDTRRCTFDMRLQPTGTV